MKNRPLLVDHNSTCGECGAVEGNGWIHSTYRGDHETQLPPGVYGCFFMYGYGSDEWEEVFFKTEDVMTTYQFMKKANALYPRYTTISALTKTQPTDIEKKSAIPM